MDAAEVHARRLNAKEVLMPKNGEHFVFPVADGTVKLSGRDQVFRRSTPIQDHPVKRRIVKRASRKHASHICSHHAHRWSGHNTRCRRPEMSDPLHKKETDDDRHGCSDPRHVRDTQGNTLRQNDAGWTRARSHWTRLVVAFSITEMEVRLVRR